VGVDILKAAVNILRAEIEEAPGEITAEELLAAAALLEEVDTLDEAPPDVKSVATDDNAVPSTASGDTRLRGGAAAEPAGPPVADDTGPVGEPPSRHD
jgi:hypothetical protein